MIMKHRYIPSDTDNFVAYQEFCTVKYGVDFSWVLCVMLMRISRFVNMNALYKHVWKVLIVMKIICLLRSLETV